MGDENLCFVLNITVVLSRTGAISVDLRDNKLLIFSKKYEPPHDKTNKMTVRPAKTQISLDIHPVWSVFTLRSMGG